MKAISLTARNVESASGTVNLGRGCVRVGDSACGEWRRDPSNPTGQFAQAGRDLAELLRCTLELTKRPRLVGCRARHVLRAMTVAARDLCDALDALRQPSDFRLL